MPVFKKQRKLISPTRVIVLSFALIIAAGTILLLLPFSTRAGLTTNLSDALFTATSATCVTGLIVADTYQHWTEFGQVVIILLIQIGGLGLVTLVAFFNLLLGKRLGLRSIQTATESVGGGGFDDAGALVKNVIMMSLIFEGIGAMLLGFVFIPEFGVEGIFVSIFIAISAFCNAGFDILGRSQEYLSVTEYNNNPYLFLIIMALIICGGLGFVVWYDLKNYRKTRRITLHTRIVLIMTGILIVGGAVLVWLFERSNPDTIGDMPLWQQIINSFFQSVTLRTAGFNSFDLASMHDTTKLVSSGLMFIGAAPGSTGGGIKVTTLAVIIFTVISVLKNREDTQMLGRRIVKAAVYRALVVFILSSCVVMITSSVVFFSDITSVNVSSIDVIYESTSAFATVGSSVGITDVSTLLARLTLIFTMFIGRVGPVSLLLSIVIGHNEVSNNKKNQVIPEGNIIIG